MTYFKAVIVSVAIIYIRISACNKPKFKCIDKCQQNGGDDNLEFAMREGTVLCFYQEVQLPMRNAAKTETLAQIDTLCRLKCMEKWEPAPDQTKCFVDFCKNGYKHFFCQGPGFRKLESDEECDSMVATGKAKVYHPECL